MSLGRAYTSVMGDTTGTLTSGRSVPPIDEPKGVDPKWREKIERAHEARALMARLRTGKAKSFRQAVGKVQ